MNRKQILESLDWINDTTLKGELPEEEAKRRLEAITKVRSDYESPDCTTNGSILIYEKDFQYRGVPFRFIICKFYRKHMPGEDAEGPPLCWQKHVDDEVDHKIELDKEKEGYFRYGNVATGMLRWLSICTGDDDEFFKPFEIRGEVVDGILNKMMDTVDWFLDEAENDIKKFQESSDSEFQALRKSALENDR